MEDLLLWPSHLVNVPRRNEVSENINIYINSELIYNENK